MSSFPFVVWSPMLFILAGQLCVDASATISTALSCDVSIFSLQRSKEVLKV